MRGYVSACDHNNRFALISAADSGTALIGVASGIDRRMDRTAVNGHIRVSVHAAANACAHIIRRICGNGSSVNRNIRAVVSGAFFVSVFIRIRWLAASQAGTNPGISGCLNRSAVYFDHSAVRMVSAADTCAVSGAGRRDISSVNRYFSPFVPCIFPGAMRRPVAWIIGAPYSGTVSRACCMNGSAFDGNISVNAMMTFGSPDSGPASVACRG